MALTQRQLFADMPEERFPPEAAAGTGAAERLREAARSDMVPVAPGARIWRPRSGDTAPDMVMCRWAKTEGGWSPVPVAGRWVRLTAAVAAQMGFRDAGRSRRYDTLLRLWRAGFIDVAHVSPGVYMIDMDSWHRHLAEVTEDDGYWEVGRGNRERYYKANGLGGWKRKLKGEKTC